MGGTGLRRRAHTVAVNTNDEVIMTNELPSSPHSAAPAGDAAATRQQKQAQSARERLRRLLRVRLERHLSTEAFRPAITVLGLRPDHRSAEVLRLGVARPEDAVLGFMLPPRFSAIGVLASSVVSRAPHRQHRDAALAIGVARNGETVSLLATADRVIDTREPQGWLVDACLRSVGRPTPSCSTAALAFPVALWLDRLMVAILDASSAEPLRWDDAVAMCPIPKPWRSADAGDLGITLASTTQSWTALRAATIAGKRSPVGITPERAAWMDDAMFARWCLGSFPDLASLRSDVEFLASPEIAEGVALTLRAAWAAFDHS